MTAGETTPTGAAADQERAPARRDATQPPADGGAPQLPAEHVDTAPGSGWPDRQALEGPFTTRQLVRLDEALRTADDATGLAFSVYVGDLDDPTRSHAAKLHARLPDPARSVLIAVAPHQRALEIVTGARARRQLPDRDCKLAALSMAAAFGGGDLAGGILNGLAQLTNRARA